MFRIVLAALRRHPAQVAAVAVLAALAAGMAAAVPTYLVGAAEVGTSAAVDSAPPSLRQVTVSKEIPAADIGREVRAAEAAVGGSLDRPGLRVVVSAYTTGRLGTGPDASVDRDIAVREGVCERLRITGSCPRGDREVMISHRMAAGLGVDVGSQATYSPNRGTPIRVTVVGRYQGGDPDDPFWAGGGLIRGEPVFATAGTITLLKSTDARVHAEARATPELFSGIEALVDARAVGSRLNRLARDGYDIDTRLDALADRVTINRRVIAAGVPVAGFTLLLLCWFALGLAVRHAGAAWRPDVGLLKLRGVPRGRVTALAVGRSAVPIVAGAVVGVVAAVALRGQVKSALGRAEAQPELVVSDRYVLLGGLGAALLTVFGSLAIAFVAERRMLREPVVDLLRRVPARQGGWRAGVAEILVATLALAAVYQVRSAPDDDPAAAGLTLFVPVLVALAVALTGTRLLVPTAAVAARRAFGAGRLSTGLALLDLARRPGARRLAALLVTASALLVTATLGWATGASTRADRAALDLGAHRVLTVGAESAAHLLTAVRAADPGGRHAMAVVVGSTGSSADAWPVVAVDSTRLVAVAGWPTGGGAGQGVEPGDLAAWLRPAAGAPVVAAGGALELDVTAPLADPPVRITVAALLVGPRGNRVTALLETPGPGRHTVRADTPGCAGHGCRLVGLELIGGSEGTDPVVLHRLGQLDPPAPLIDGKGFADLARWRQPLISRKPFLLASNAGDGLALRMDRVVQQGESVPGESSTQVRPGVPDPLRLEVVDAPLPLPVVINDARGEVRRAGGQPGELLGAGGIPLRRIATPAVLPRIGTRGLVVDLEYADRLLVGVDGVREVWLADGAPAGLVERLRAEGLEILRTDTLADATDRYAAQGGIAVLRLHLVVALAGLLLAAASVVLVAAIDRPVRTAELAALRVQGVPARAVVRSVTGGYALVTGVATALGVLAALVAHRLAGDRPIFDDGWELLTPTGPGWPAIALLAVALGGVLGGAVVLAARGGDR
ncbi:FtsX-like permease family protein [Virgisporangium ochraceum]|uniref:ABC3 transporter permease C-terminal domain-containing protein n=1 Tax=Virgisporangium ochraceum TaxID=65505 RepID=A0A8J3ZKG5_9ACTN|nr:FtsX-like permease family protein [Virgisporangium ochraceum]GIJ65974.1 hypothetical protein Voc01_008910 [Virgisporangium ochraceum]